MRFHTPSHLSPRQSLTPEGFLVCEAVPIARTGSMVYGAGEVPVDPGPDGIIRIERGPDEVFRAETIASYEGKAVTLDHPSDWVTPDTWRGLAVGICQNVRRGTGIEDDLLLADLVIADADVIAQVRAGLREVSCGYDADYEQEEPGRGVQRNIVGNHVALVERGRCGSRCAIGDKETPMAKQSVFARIRNAFKSKDEAAMEEALKEAEAKTADESEEEEKEEEKADSKTADALAKILSRMDTMDAAIARLTKDADEEEAKKDEDEEEGEKEEKKTADAATRTIDRGVWQLAISRAEILAPGLKAPTFDAKAVGALCACQRAALSKARDTEATRELLAPLLAGRDLGTLTGDALDTVFTAAAEMVRQKNNAAAVRPGGVTRDFGGPMTPDRLNQINREFWAKRAS